MAEKHNRVPLNLNKFLKYDGNLRAYALYNGISYNLTLEQLDDIKRYFHSRKDFHVTPKEWFNQLTKEGKKQVIREGYRTTEELFDDGAHLD